MRKTYKIFFSFLVLALLVGLLPGYFAKAAPTDLVINGSFEVPLVSHSKKWNIYDSGTTHMGWSVEWMPTVPATYSGYNRPHPAHLELHHGVNNWLPQDGAQYAELDTDWDGPDGSLTNEPASVKIYQDTHTLPGRTYDLTFYYSPRPGTGSAENILEVWWDGVKIDTIYAGAGGSNTNWTAYNYSATASGTLTRLEFRDVGQANSLGIFLDNVSLLDNTRDVYLDIKPTSCPNPFNVGKKGVMPVAVLGTEDFDVADIDVSTILLEGVAPLRHDYEDVTTPYEEKLTDRNSCTTEDGDGYLDLTLKFSTQELVAALGTVNDGDELILTLTSSLNDGTPIEGQDIVWIIKKK